MENATWRILSNEAVQFRRNSLTTEARRRLARLTVYGRDLINSLHRYIEITLPEIERTLTLGFAVRPENKPQDKGRKGPEKVFLEIQDPTVSLIYSGKKDNYLYPGQGKHSCRVQAHVLTNLEELNTQQVEFFKEAIQKSHCYSKGTANILEISPNNSRFSWLAYHLQRKLDPQRQGACLNCIYFTELFKDYPRNLTSILSQSSSSNFEGASGANQNLASFWEATRKVNSTQYYAVQKRRRDGEATSTWPSCRAVSQIWRLAARLENPLTLWRSCSPVE